MRHPRIPAFVIACALASAPALAQTANTAGHDGQRPQTTGQPQQVRPPSRPPRAPRPPVGLHAYGLFELEKMAAGNSFTAVYESSTMFGFGGGIDVTRLFGGLFMRFAFVRGSKDGESVAVDGDEVFPLGTPISAALTTIDLGGGWRFHRRGTTPGATPYVGAGFAITQLKETDAFSEQDGDAVDFPRHWGYTFFGGVDVPLGRNGVFSVEGQWRIVPDGLTRGVSVVFDETDLGGFVVRAMVGFRK